MKGVFDLDYLSSDSIF